MVTYHMQIIDHGFSISTFIYGEQNIKGKRSIMVQIFITSYIITDQFRENHLIIFSLVNSCDIVVSTVVSNMSGFVPV